MALLLLPLGSMVVDETESVWVIVDPCATVVLTFTTKVKFAVVAPPIVVVSVQVRVASTHVHPAGPVNDTAEVFAGRASVNTGALAVAGPLFVTLCVYVMLLPAVTGFGLPELVTLKSACVPAATAMFTAAALFNWLVSCVVVVAASTSEITVPAAVPAFT